MGIKHSLAQYPPFALAREVKWTVERHFRKDDDPIKRVVTLEPHGPSKGTVLFSRINDAFLLQPGQSLSAIRKNSWEAYAQAMLFTDLGYSVDVVHFLNHGFIPEKDYDVFFDVGWNMERMVPLLDTRCLKLLHITTAHPFFNNVAELKRLTELQQRRGISLLPRRQIWRMNRAIEYADYATILGNDFAVNTYKFAGKAIHRVPSSAPLLYPWPENKNFESCREHFIWFAGCGLVHKGLDLLLEAFAAMPEYHLWVCGSVEDERDFADAYHRELYGTNNIHVLGWMDLNDPRLLDVMHKCVSLLHPSCSECGGSAVVTSMHAGLIPIVSYESSVDVNPDCGVVLKKSTIEEIQEAVHSIAHLPANTLRNMARSTWERARAEHSPEKFIEEYKKAVLQALSAHGNTRLASTPPETANARAHSA